MIYGKNQSPDPPFISHYAIIQGEMGLFLTFSVFELQRGYLFIYCLLYRHIWTVITLIVLRVDKVQYRRRVYKIILSSIPQAHEHLPAVFSLQLLLELHVCQVARHEVMYEYVAC